MSYLVSTCILPHRRNKTKQLLRVFLNLYIHIIIDHSCNEKQSHTKLTATNAGREKNIVLSITLPVTVIVRLLMTKKFPILFFWLIKSSSYNVNSLQMFIVGIWGTVPVFVKK